MRKSCSAASNSERRWRPRITTFPNSTHPCLRPRTCGSVSSWPSGTARSPRPCWREPCARCVLPGLREGETDTLLGKKIVTSAYAPEIAAGVKTVLFGDLSYYWIGDRQGITFKRLNERYADLGQVGFLASKRVDGKLVLPEAIKVLQMKAGTASK